VNEDILPIAHITLEKDPEVKIKCTTARLRYYKRFRGAPAYILLNPKDFAALQFDIWKTVVTDKVLFEDMRVLCKEGGEPECVIREEHFKQALYEDSKGAVK